MLHHGAPRGGRKRRVNSDTGVEAARQSLSSFCMTACRASCCRKGFVVLRTMDEAALLGVPWDQSKQYAVLDVRKGCVKLEGDACSIYAQRPAICREFPLFERGRTLVIAGWCPGYRAGLLDRFVQDTKRDGRTVIVQ
ncbi:YkgJ family cysteine cluster protein [Candidatus Woesearchaeota archaeon]|nr:YkgJ family cysteine cluster protein [Candidatus Woesearchaeota archaeon]